MLRSSYIDQYFLNIKLNKDYPDIYCVRSSILKAIKSFSPKFKGKLLDVGCGIMPYRELILNTNKNVTSYIGLDFENSLDSEYSFGKPDFFWNGDIIPLEDNAVETIIATEFFEHCTEPEKIMKEILRVLKPDGVLFLTVPFIWNLHLVPYDEYRYTPFALKRHLLNAGYTNIEINALGGMDASLAQMLAIWYRNRPMRSLYKKYLGPIIVSIIRWLLNADSRADKNKIFAEGSMITGLSGVAYKN
jgi:SAM-dependent methyltransferase